ncbi:diaminopimelate epimerase [Chryseobacterium suipulveris]|uniref:Diaminopimelate epimerase n=1 Tax=Chryseobacterium suipulveris TaxID=2929800 RepID=A0ABY4BTB0_9FLAO|nr:diaminopimelate epimerase [Chryseobacterium suipulveris]UOE42438.1 diaminopimelate epimerase [Chryseobacterium suipulveris]
MEFFKYQGTGNDFVMIDNRDLQFPKDRALIEKLCDRRFGIGGDGLILLENATETFSSFRIEEKKVADPDSSANEVQSENSEIFTPTLKGAISEFPDFKMVYYNSDGNESTMCGNGGRCIVAFAHFLDIFEDRTTFIAIDGLHEAEIKNGIVKLKMGDVNSIKNLDGNFELNTGSPHFVKFVDDVENYEVYTNGNEIRNSATYKTEGINVNFAEEISDGEIFVRTYERGVEDETYSCGTGVTASALVFMKDKNQTSVKVKVLGGNLKVYADKDGDSFKNIWLEGPAKQVFRGKIDL